MAPSRSEKYARLPTHDEADDDDDPLTLDTSIDLTLNDTTSPSDPSPSSEPRTPPDLHRKLKHAHSHAAIQLSPSSQRVFADFESRFKQAQRLPSAALLPPRPPRPSELSPRRIRAILVLIFTVTIFYGLDSTVVATLATPISSGFGQLHRAAWLNSSYLFSLACFTPLYGRLSDILGRRMACGIGLSLFILGSLLCALAPTMTLLILARLIQGAGGGGAGMMGSIIISDVVSLRQRGLLNAVSSVCWATGAGLGGVYGGVVADTLGWRWAFLLQVPALVIVMLGLLWTVNYTLPGQNGSWRAVGARLDWTGSGLLVVGIGAFVFSLSFKTNEGLPWSHPSVYLTLALSLLSLLAFGLFEGYVANEPVLPLRLLRDVSRLCIAVSVFLASAATIAIGLFFPMLLQIVRGNAAALAGLHLMPNTIAGACGGVTAGFYIRTTGKYRTLIQLLAILQILPCFLLSRVGAGTWEMFTWVVLMPQGFATSGFSGSTFIALLSNISAKDTAVATSITFLFRSFGQVIGMSLSSAIQQSVLEAELTKDISGEDAAAIVAEVRRNATAILDLSPTLRTASIGAYATSLHAVFLLNGVLAVVALLLTFFVKEYPVSDSLPNLDEDEDESKLEASYEDDEAEMTAL